MQSDLEAMQTVATAAEALRDAIEAASNLHIIGIHVRPHEAPQAHLCGPERISIDTVMQTSGGAYLASETGGLSYSMEISVEVGGCRYFALVKRDDPMSERLRLRAQALAARRKRTGYPGTQHPMKERQHAR